jgi:signal transduction histidine kinase
MDSLKQLSNNIAHDLRTPLGRLRQLLDSARLQPLSSPQYQNLIDRSVDEIDSILELFGAVLRISQIESGSRRSGFKRFCLSEMVDEICETFTPAFEEDGKSLTADIVPDLWILGDQELLTLSLANLLENANVHTPDKTMITVSVGKTGSCVELCVADNGGGVPEADRNRIFQRFYRLESSRTTAGNGLGLSIVAAVADLHTAEVSASDNKPGLRIGMTFPSAA